MSLSNGHNNLGKLAATGSHDISNCSSEGTEWSEPAAALKIVFALIVLLGAPGNGAVIWVTGFNMERNVYTVCFLNLAVADLSYCLIFPSLLACSCLPGFPSSDIFWRLLRWIFRFHMSVIAVLLTLISIVRCLSITRPVWFQYHKGLVWVRAACFGAWALASLLCLPEFLHFSTDSYSGAKIWVAFEVTGSILSFGPPLLIMAMCYILVARTVKGKMFHKSRYLVQLIVTMVSVFIVSWFPITVCDILWKLSVCISMQSLYLTFSLASLNSTVNPVIYVFSGRDFRQVFRRSLAATLRLAFAEEKMELETDPPIPTVCAVSPPSQGHFNDCDVGPSEAGGGGGCS
ncbi:C3a anaphylatoxin chemotactic receptor-like [Hypanus sabinus]|uniref:C3a anaphylatoxin chemotactic receptor-like n=1 Tax=Hypanus sabinus TaxID=79690 RepID=UPI0028C47DE4|nr:C3a anaphylatoxin chemotactic receptor-like [Hypanus sabinus]